MPIYQRPLSPYRRVPGVPGTPSVASAHRPAGTCPPQAAPGTCGAPRAAAHPGPPRRPHERRERGDLAAALCRAGGGRSFLRTCPEQAERPRRLQRPACAHSDLQPPPPPHRPRQRPPRQRLVAAERRPSGGLNTCGARQAGLCESGEVKLQGWCNVRPVTRTLVRMNRWLDACMCICMSVFEMQKRTSLGQQPLRAAERTATARMVFERRRRR